MPVKVLFDYIEDDGSLLEAMVGKFDALVTIDASLVFQQRIAGRPVGVIVLRAKTSRVAHRARPIPQPQRELRRAAPGEMREIG